MLEGGCECGSVRYRLLADPIFVNCCHCRQCQRSSGSAFAINAMIERDRVEILSGADGLVTHQAETRCSQCDILLWALHPRFGDSILFLRAGTLDLAERVAPDCHFFVRSRHPWVVFPDGVRAFGTLPGEGDSPLLSPEAAARIEAVRGSLAPVSRHR